MDLQLISWQFNKLKIRKLWYLLSVFRFRLCYTADLDPRTDFCAKIFKAILDPRCFDRYWFGSIRFWIWNSVCAFTFLMFCKYRIQMVYGNCYEASSVSRYRTGTIEKSSFYWCLYDFVKTGTGMVSNLILRGGYRYPSTYVIVYISTGTAFR
jgi:hypothetical protein